MGDSVFLLFSFFCRFLVALSISKLLQNPLHDRFLSKTSDEFVLGLSFFLLDNEHMSI